MSAAARRAHWRDLVERRLPEAARPDWPVRLDHCFGRILLDHACGGPWRDQVRPPAHATLPLDQLETAIALGEAVLAGHADLALLNRRSLAWRGKIPPAPVPAAIRDGGLILRRWRPEDAAPFAALNADPAVMAHFPRPGPGPRAPPRPVSSTGASWRTGSAPGRWSMTAGSSASRARCGSCGPCPSRAATGRAVRSSWLGAWRGRPGGGASPPVPRGWPWPISPGAAASAPSWLSRRVGNVRSRAVMERLGMAPSGTFPHPAVPEGPLREHVLYRLDGADREVAA